MRGTRILTVFFIFFAIASFLIPVPMFPGSFLSTLLGERIRDYMNVLSAMLNGVFYGALMWIIFVGISRKLGE